MTLIYTILDNTYFEKKNKKKKANIYIYIQVHKDTAIWSPGLLGFEK